MPDGFELFLGVAVERWVHRVIAILGVARHDRRGCNALRPVHPALEVIVAQALARQLEIRALALEDRRRLFAAGIVAGDARVTLGAGELGAEQRKLGVRFRSCGLHWRAL